MKKTVALLCAMALLLGLWAAPASAEGRKALKILIVSSSGVDDGNFNQDCYSGIQAFLADHPDYHLLPLTTLADWLPPLYRAQAAQGMVQLLPDEQGMEGFFLALMEKGEEV